MLISNSKCGKTTVTLPVYVLLFLVFCSPIQAADMSHHDSVISLTDSTNKVSLDPYIELLVDEGRDYTIEDIASGKLDGQFVRYSGEGRPNFGYTKSAYWVRIQVHNQSSSEKDWLMGMDTPKLNVVALYKQDSTMSKRVAGNWQRFHDRDVYHRNLVFNMTFPTDQIQTYYLRITTGSSMQIPLTIWDKNAFNQHVQFEYALFGILFGISVVMAMYNLFLYFSVGARSYLYYSLFVVFNCLLYLSDTGLAFQYLWPEQVGWNLSAVVTLMCLDNIAGLLFARSFLETARFVPKIDLLYKMVMILNVCAVILSHYSNFGSIYFAVICVIFTAVLVFISVAIIWTKGYRPARFFALAWSVFLFGVLTSLLVDAGIIRLTLFTRYAWEFTTAIEVILLSFALGDKFRMIRDEKERAEQKVKDSQRLANQLLEVKVRERTSELEKVNTELIQMARSRRDLMANIAHELGNPLTVIQGYMQAIQAGVVTGDQSRYTDMVYHKVTILNRLIKDLLELSRFEANQVSLRKEGVRLDLWMKKIVDKFGFEVKQGERRFGPPPQLNIEQLKWYVCDVDRDRLDQVYSNLISNAIKYTSPEDGEISISFDVNEALGEWTIKVMDNGYGMDELQLPRIFERLYRDLDTTDYREVEGTGLGLAIAKHIVERHGGTIWAESELNQGSVFCVTLPMKRIENE